jgi:hypothetical protein
MARQQPRIINIDDYRGGLNQRDSRAKIQDNEAVAGKALVDLDL